MPMGKIRWCIGQKGWQIDHKRDNIVLAGRFAATNVLIEEGFLGIRSRMHGRIACLQCRDKHVFGWQGPAQVPMVQAT
jgi:hypothetical protein